VEPTHSPPLLFLPSSPNFLPILPIHAPITLLLPFTDKPAINHSGPSSQLPTNPSYEEGREKKPLLLLPLSCAMIIRADAAQSESAGFGNEVNGWKKTDKSQIRMVRASRLPVIVSNSVKQKGTQVTLNNYPSSATTIVLCVHRSAFVCSCFLLIVSACSSK
jgi:hypothetical protein